ncbi:hypothetical protein GCM10022419_004690 [Nonomuraea rosea]|uniref:Uncharacterized protein n=1 Tax=Nonomuraea rosea TaxID=638574 RepID=A0ABP6V7N4_9ACTN
MRGQEPGSEHDRREADGSAAPATPPPSFGQTNGRDVPPALTPSDEAADAEARPVVPIFQGPPPDLPEPDGVPAWELPDDDAAPYDWFTDHPETDLDLPDGTLPTHPADRTQADFTRADPTWADHVRPGHPQADDVRPDLVGPDHTRPGHPVVGRSLSDPAWAAPSPPHQPLPEHPPTTQGGPPHPATAQSGPPHASADPESPRHLWETKSGHAPGDPEPARHPWDAQSGPPHTPGDPEPARHPWDAQSGPPHTPGDPEPVRHPWDAQSELPHTPGGPEPVRHPWDAHEGPPPPWPANPADQADQADQPPVWSANSPDQPPAWPKKADGPPAPWPVEPVVPGAPPWEPPPAFTAAAAGMPVWPAPVTDPHAMPPWPAATGELVAEPDADEPETTAARFAASFDPPFDAPLDAPFDANATNPEGFTRPANFFDPDAIQQQDTTHPVLKAPGLSDQNTEKPEAGQQQAGQQQAWAAGEQTARNDDSRAEGPKDARNKDAQNKDAQDDDGRDQDATRPGSPLPRSLRPGGAPMLPAPTAPPAAPPREETQPFAHEDIARPLGHDPAKSEQDATRPAHYFDPVAARHDFAAMFDPHPTNPAASPPANPSGNPPEPGDVPVWPPVPPTPTPTSSGEKLPDLPFSRDTWGQRPTTSLELPTPPPGGGAFPPGAFKQPPFQTPPPPPAPPGRSKRALLVTLGALALAGVATGGFFAWQAVSTPTPTTAAAQPSTSVTQPDSLAAGTDPAVTPTIEVPGASVLNSEQTDPQKLSLSEAFPKKKVSAAGTTFTRVKAAIETTCEKAATGAFADALKEHKCSRVLRATYVDSKRRYAVTTGIAVLPTKDAATTADQAKSLTRNVWFRPLPGAAGTGGERVHIAGGYAAGLVWGRYIVFSYATHADGHTPEAEEKTLPKVSGAFRDQTSLVLERRITKG